jgi:hypothetical protein
MLTCMISVCTFLALLAIFGTFCVGHGMGEQALDGWPLAIILFIICLSYGYAMWLGLHTMTLYLSQ